MNPSEHYAQAPLQQRQWPPQLLSPPSSQQQHQQSPQASFPSPPPSSIAEHNQSTHFPSFYQAPSAPPPSQSVNGHHLSRSNGSSASLSLNLSSLSVTSPTNLSPIGVGTPGPGAMSPATPISPGGNTYQHFGGPQFQFPAESQQPQNHSPPNGGYDDGVSGYDSSNAANNNNNSSASAGGSSSGTSTLPRKRSFTSTPAPPRRHTPISTAPPSRSGSIEESMYDDGGPPGSAHPYDDMSGYPDSGEDSACLSPNPGGANSASSPGGIAVPTLSLNMNFMGGSGNGSSGGLANGSSMSVLGKPVGTNNFVTKLYQ